MYRPQMTVLVGASDATLSEAMFINITYDLQDGREWYGLVTYRAAVA